MTMTAIHRGTAGAKRHHTGFSLIELLMALVILGVLFATVPPAYRDWIAAQQLANHAHFVADTLDRARSEAIKHGYRVSLCKTQDGRQCTDRGGWESGWLMYVDENHDGEIDPDEIVLHRERPAPDGITMHGNRPVADYVSYTSLGHARLLNGALQMGTFVVCKPGQNALKVVLANSGRARIDKTHEQCP
jgi:type IV fimbrial biogenesis protein FimT